MCKQLQKSVNIFLFIFSVLQCPQSCRDNIFLVLIANSKTDCRSIKNSVLKMCVLKEIIVGNIM